MNSLQSKCGFVAIVGEPNSGKSTLLNAIVGEKVSIVSSKCQTTRYQVKGITQYDDAHAQIVFIDTPGFFKAKTSLERMLVSNFKYAYKGADIILLMIDPLRRNLDYTFAFIEKLGRNQNQKLIIAINKIDVATKKTLLDIAEKLSKYDFIDYVFMISAKTNDGIGDIIEYLKNNVPEGPYMYEIGVKTDLDIRYRLAEITREKLYNVLSKELPYKLYVETEFFSESEKKARIFQSIIVSKESHKGIVLGHNGERIKYIKDMAILDMRSVLGKKVELKLFVKVKEDWTEKRSHLQSAGLIN